MPVWEPRPQTEHNAGNDRGNGPGAATNYYYAPSTTAFHTLRANPGANERDWRNGDDDPNGFDTVLAPGTCKNVLTVGACQDIAYADPANPAQLLLGFTSTASFTMAAFSGCGPTDDGRIKPDVVSVGQAAPAVRGFGIVAPVSASDTNYSTGWAGTSFATPSVTGCGDTPRAASITSLLRAPAGNQVTLNFAADPGAYFTVQTSTNLSTWTNDGSVYAAAVTNSVTRSASAAEPKRYWRLKRGQP